MNIPKKKNVFILVAFIAIIATWRVVTYFFDHNGLVGLTPIFAVALFGSAYLRGSLLSVAVPLAALFLSDLVLCFTVYTSFRQGLLYEGWYWVYMSFILIIFAGRRLLRQVSIGNIITAILVSTLIHWLVATLSECVQMQSSGSFMQLYVARLVSAASYELRVLTGTLIYSALLFGGYHLLTTPRLKEAN